MAEESQSLKSLFEEAERLRSTLDTFSTPNSSSFQEILAKSIERYERCNLAANHVSMFSLNESVEDVATGDLPLVPSDSHVEHLLRTPVVATSSSTIILPSFCHGAMEKTAEARWY